MISSKINLHEKFSKFSKHWSPRVIAEMNNYQFKIAKIKGEFVWHDHKDTDETFIVIEGSIINSCGESISLTGDIFDKNYRKLFAQNKNFASKTQIGN